MRKLAAASGIARTLSDTMEALFGPDPGLLRLQKAGRSVISATLSLLALLLPKHGGFMPTAGVALGFMISIFASMMVQGAKKSELAVSFLLLILPPLPSIMLAALLAPWQWAIDLCFVVLVIGVIIARQAGPRGAAMGMTAYIAYFMGAILHPGMAQMPLLALAVAVGLANAALVRFLVLPDRPRFTLHHTVRHIDRRIGRILDVVRASLGSEERVRFGTRSDNRLHREMANLNDAVLTAEGQVAALPGADEGSFGPLSDALFGVDLAAERLIRAASFHPPSSSDRQAAQRRIAELQASLDADAPTGDLNGARRPLHATAERFGEGAESLEDAVAALKQAMAAAVDHARPPEPPPDNPSASRGGDAI